MSTDTTEPPKYRRKLANWEKEAKRKQAAHQRARAADSPSSWPEWPLKKHLEHGQIDLVVNGMLPLQPGPKLGDNLPIVRDVHGPLAQLDRIVTDLEQTGVVDHAAFERMHETLALIDRSDRTPPTWGEARRMLARLCRAIANCGEEDDAVDYSYYYDDDGDDGDDDEPAPPPEPPTSGPYSWAPWSAEDAADAGQGNIDLA